MDYEILENLTNATYEGIPSEISKEFLAHELVLSLVCLLAFCADVIMIYTIFYFKQMRTISNLLLGNWIIADICCILVTPSGYRVLSAIGNFNISYPIVCGAFGILSACRTVEMLFAIAVCIDWLSGIYFPRLSEKIKNYYKIIVAFFWIGTIINCSTGIGLCISDFIHFAVLEATQIITYCILLFLVIVSLITIGVHTCSGKTLNYTTHTIMLTTALIIVYFLGFVFTVFYTHVTLETFVVSLVYLDAVVNFVILYFFHRDFKANLLKIGQRSSIGYSESFSYRKDSLVNNRNNDVPVQIAFHNPTEELISNAY